MLDEVHYLGDPGRGSVWEEVIINCPKHIQLLGMSATVKNPDDLGDWISKVGRRVQAGQRRVALCQKMQYQHEGCWPALPNGIGSLLTFRASVCAPSTFDAQPCHTVLHTHEARSPAAAPQHPTCPIPTPTTQEHRKCVTIKTRFRPVPLRWHFCYGSNRGATLKELLVNNGRALSPQLETRAILMEEARSMLVRGRRVTDPVENSKWDRAIRSFMDNPDKQVGGAGAGWRAEAVLVVIGVRICNGAGVLVLMGAGVPGLAGDEILHPCVLAGYVVYSIALQMMLTALDSCCVACWCCGSTPCLTMPPCPVPGGAAHHVPARACPGGCPGRGAQEQHAARHLVHPLKEGVRHQRPQGDLHADHGC